MRLQPRRAANEKHACHDNGYGFLTVWLMFYSRAAPKPLHAVLQEETDKCRGEHLYMERLPAGAVLNHIVWLKQSGNLLKRPCCSLVDAGTCRVISSRRGKKVRANSNVLFKRPRRRVVGEWRSETEASRGERDRNISIFNRPVGMWGRWWDVSNRLDVLVVCSPSDVMLCYFVSDCLSIYLSIVSPVYGIAKIRIDLSVVTNFYYLYDGSNVVAAPHSRIPLHLLAH